MQTVFPTCQALSIDSLARCPKQALNYPADSVVLLSRDGDLCHLGGGCIKADMPGFVSLAIEVKSGHL